MGLFAEGLDCLGVYHRIGPLALEMSIPEFTSGEERGLIVGDEHKYGSEAVFFFGSY